MKVQNNVKPKGGQYMKERIYTYKVTATLADVKKEIHFLLTNGEFSVDYYEYDTAEEALENFLYFMLSAFNKKSSSSIHFDLKPYIYEVIDEKRLISVRRVVIGSKELKSEACFLLDSFKNCSLNDIITFIKDYCESDCSKEVRTISFIPIVNSNVSNYQVLDFGFIFSIDEIKGLTVEELKEKMLETKLIGYMYL